LEFYTRSVERGVRRQRNTRCYVGMAVVATVTVLVGLAPTFYLRGHLPMPPLTALLIVHGIIGTVSIALFLGQSLLVRSRQIHLYKRLGIVGALLTVPWWHRAIRRACRSGAC
jgi:hypothetical protein